MILINDRMRCYYLEKLWAYKVQDVEHFCNVILGKYRMRCYYLEKLWAYKVQDVEHFYDVILGKCKDHITWSMYSAQ